MTEHRLKRGEVRGLGTFLVEERKPVGLDERPVFLSNVIIGPQLVNADALLSIVAQAREARREISSMR